MNFTRACPGGAACHSAARIARRRKEHGFADSGIGSAHGYTVYVVVVAIADHITPPYKRGGIVQSGALQDLRCSVIARTTGKHGSKVIGDLDLETSQRGGEIITLGGKLSPSRQHGQQQQDKKNRCYIFHTQASCAPPKRTGTLAWFELKQISRSTVVSQPLLRRRSEERRVG